MYQSSFERSNIILILIHRVSPHDVAAIKNVYERVWLMTVIEEEEKKKHILPPGQLARPPSKRDVSPQPKKEDSIDSDDFDPRA